jgi:hypothetical protein
VAAPAPAPAHGGRPLVRASLERSLARASAPLSDDYGPELGYLQADGEAAAADANGRCQASGEGAAAAAPAVAASREDLEQGGRGGACSPSGAACCWRLVPPAAGEAVEPEVAAAVALRLRREHAAMLPPLQVGLLALILLSVVATNVAGGFLVSRPSGL